VLWACIQAANHWLLHADPVLFNLALSWLLLASIGSLLFLLARRDGLPLSLSFCFALSPAFCGNFIWLGLIGMEHLLFVAVLLATIYFWLDLGRHRRRSALLAGIGIGLLAITRPEAMVLGPLIVATAWVIKRSTREALSALALWAAFLAITIATNLHTSHTWMPATLQGRTWLYFHGWGGPHSFRSIAIFLFGWLLRPAMQFSLWDAAPDVVLFRPGFMALFPAVIVLLGAFRILRSRPQRVTFLFLLALAHFTLYLLIFPSMGHAGRYQPVTLLLLFPCLTFGVLWILEHARKLDPQIAIALAAAILLVAGAVSLGIWRRIAMDGIGHINGTHGRAAQWILQNEPANAPVAAFDIGKISYVLNRPIIDLGGLADASYEPYLRSGSAPLYLEDRHVGLVVLPSGGLAAQLGFSQSQLENAKVAQFCNTPHEWLVGFKYTSNAEQCQIVYKFPWQGPQTAASQSSPNRRTTQGRGAAASL
jgi:hypothetical protein